MADESPRPDPEPEQIPDTTTAVTDEAEGEEKPPKKLNQQVDIQDAGACRKHVKVSIPREDIEARFNEKFSELVSDSTVPGYRPGKAPRKLIEKRFYKDVSEQLKAELLMQSLEQMSEDHKLSPIAQPELDPFKIEMPKDGPFEYEFEVEVAPEFELPDYKGLKLKRPVRDIKVEEVEKAERRFLSRYGTLVPKDGGAEMDDFLIADVEIRSDGKEIGKLQEITVRVDRQLAFKDGMVEDFGAKMIGVKAGEPRSVDIQLTPSTVSPGLRGKTVEGVFHVKDVKYLRVPELTHEFLHTVGVHNPEQLREKVRTALQRQLEYEQRRSAREQVLQHIAAAATWELPRDLLARQTRKTIARRIMEMRSAGLPDDEIRSRSTLLQQDAFATTERALKEHFVLQKISEVEKIEVKDDDVDYEIESIAAQSDESPRRVRARLEKEELMESLMTQIVERKALDLVLDNAEYEDVPFEQEAPVSAIEEQAVPGEAPEESEPAKTTAS